MIIAFKDHVRINGNGDDIMVEFIKIAIALMIPDKITPEVLKNAVDIACIVKDESK